MLADIAPWPVYSSHIGSTVAEMVSQGMVFDYSGSYPVTELESRFVALHDGGYAVSFNSGTSALFAAMASLGITAGDEVIIPNLTFMASGTPLLWLGASLVLADSEPSDPSIGFEAIVSAITPMTRAIVVTHLFGNPVDIVPIAELCRARNIRLVEDCSHAHASMVGEQHVGAFGDAAVYSLGARKLVSGGHGGMLVTRDPMVRDTAMLIGHFKPRTRSDVLTPSLQRYGEVALGGNLRMPPIAAALALDHLTRLPELSRNRHANVAVLREAFDGLLTPVLVPSPRVNVSHYDIVFLIPQYVASQNRSQYLERLCAAGIPVSAPSTRPLNRVLQRGRQSPARGCDNVFFTRYDELARNAPRDEYLPYSTLQHDRMISFPAERLYRSDTSAAEWIAERARPILLSLLQDFAT